MTLLQALLGDSKTVSEALAKGAKEIKRIGESRARPFETKYVSGVTITKLYSNSKGF